MVVSCYELGRQPVAAAFAVAALEDAGWAPRVLDLAVGDLTPATLDRMHFVVFLTPMHTALRVAVREARRLREVRPGLALAFAGVYAALNREWLFGAGLADFVLAGEFEPALVDLVASLADGGDGAVPGVARRGDAAPYHPPTHRVQLPLPARRGLPGLERYAHLVDADGVARTAGAVEATRGCKHRCRHCPLPAVYGGRFLAVDTDTVMADIAQLVAHGATHVTFADPDFLNGPTHARRILRQMHSAFPALTADLTIKIEHLVEHEALLPELAEHGVLFIVSAVESLSPVVLRHLDKGHRRADVERALRACHAAGLTLRPTFVPFTPWTTLRDYREMLAFIGEHELIGCVDAVQYGIRLLVPPGSLLLADPDSAGAFGRFDETAMGHRWTHPDPRMDVLAEAVATRVAHAAHAGEPPAATFAAVWDLAAAADGARDAAPPVSVIRQAPRLSEPWFC